MRARGLHILLVFIVSLPTCLSYGGVVEVYGGPFALLIPADTGTNIGWMDDAVIEISEHLIINDLDVSIDISHTNVFNLDIFLVGPGGRQITLNAYDVNDFFTAADYTGTTFDDEALTSIEQGQAPFTGRFKPKDSDPLSVFDGTDAFGQWRLRIEDTRYNDSGVLTSFQLLIATPEPATMLLFGAGIALLARKSRL